jgi:hypothetical protein
MAAWPLLLNQDALLAMVAAKARKFYDDAAKERMKRKPADSAMVTLPQQKAKARDRGVPIKLPEGGVVSRERTVGNSGNPSGASSGQAARNSCEE